MVKFILLATLAYLVWHFFLKKCCMPIENHAKPRTPLKEDKYYDYKPDQEKLEKMREQFK